METCPGASPYFYQTIPMANNKTGFTSSFGVVMAAAGSAVGLGNIWRFPYICGENGGAASLIVYLFFVFLIGMVLLMTEFVIGRRSGYAPEKAFPALCPKHPSWKMVGLFGMFTCFLILSIYLVISGWTMGYFWESLTGELAAEKGNYTDHFVRFSSSIWKPAVFLTIFLVLTLVVILGGVQKGIEKVSKLLMPILLVLVILLCVRSVTLPGASRGLEYLLSPDFSKLTAKGILDILGQALFSLSVGMGAMIVYGSYIPRDSNILKTATWITICDVVIAVLAGIAIFPAVFSVPGLQADGGPSLVYEVLPVVFNSMGTLGTIFAVVFFLLLTLAALTSAISLLETLTAWLTDRGMKRNVAAMIISMAELALAVVVAYSYQREPLDNGLTFEGGLLSGIRPGNMNFYDWINNLTGSYLPPIGALFTVIFLGWVMKKEDVRDELSNHGTLRVAWFDVFYGFLVRYLAPIALVVALIAGIF